MIMCEMVKGHSHSLPFHFSSHDLYAEEGRRWCKNCSVDRTLQQDMGEQGSPWEVRGELFIF